MENRVGLTKILAGAGTLLVWVPIAAPILLTLAELLKEGLFRLDYLMPAELFPLVLVGGGLLLWAAWLRRSQRGLIGWSLGSAVILLVGLQALAEVTGLASGRTAPGGWQSALVLAGLIGYILAVVATGVGGARLLRDLFSPGTGRK